jgi:hypothetical protein
MISLSFKPAPTRSLAGSRRVHVSGGCLTNSLIENSTSVTSGEPSTSSIVLKFLTKVHITCAGCRQPENIFRKHA